MKQRQKETLSKLCFILAALCYIGVFGFLTRKGPIGHPPTIFVIVGVAAAVFTFLMIFTAYVKPIDKLSLDTHTVTNAEVKGIVLLLLFLMVSTVVFLLKLNGGI